ncbi:MAG TPA: peptidoglycan-binding domain-containing protein [Myxococcaceae bacterium]|nr:peptidoglycan-binding domain-containing protein [Myxococcaceae bacterium]
MPVNAPTARPVQPPQSPRPSSADSVGQHTMLQTGSRGPEVSDLQNRLKQAGLQVGQSGVFDAKTQSAVRQYQQAKGLQVDGVVGQQTWGSFWGQKLPPGAQMLKGGGGVSADPTGRNKDSFDPGGARGPGGAAPSPAGTGTASGPAGAFPTSGSNRDKLDWAERTAKAMGLTITSTTGGTHVAGSYHYQGRAVDVAGSPAQMAKFFDVLHNTRPTELFYDPKGAVKNGSDIPPIGGHSDHVHVAF